MSMSRQDNYIRPLPRACWGFCMTICVIRRCPHRQTCSDTFQRVEADSATYFVTDVFSFGKSTSLRLSCLWMTARYWLFWTYCVPCKSRRIDKSFVSSDWTNSVAFQMVSLKKHSQGHTVQVRCLLWRWPLVSSQWSQEGRRSLVCTWFARTRRKNISKRHGGIARCPWMW